MYGYESMTCEQYGRQCGHEDITWEQFEQRFREAYGREMTPHEHHWFHSIWTVVYGGEQEKSNGAAA
jgi:hypothetical protein